MKFGLNQAQIDRVASWLKEQGAVVAKKQGRENPYYGASGGAITYSFTQTTIGLIIEVRHAMTKETIDVTDYDSW